jgi:hypothetical protein
MVASTKRYEKRFSLSFPLEYKLRSQNDVGTKTGYRKREQQFGHLKSGGVDDAARQIHKS